LYHFVQHHQHLHHRHLNDLLELYYQFHQDFLVDLMVLVWMFRFVYLHLLLRLLEHFRLIHHRQNHQVFLVQDFDPRHHHHNQLMAIQNMTVYHLILFVLAMGPQYHQHQLE
jgi:hypothetical protein